MVFGWGKKHEESVSEKIETKKVEIQFTETEKILEDMHRLRENTLIAEVKVFRNKILANLNKSIIAMLLKNNIDIIDLSLDKNNNDYWLLDRHTSKKGNEKRVFIIHDYLKKFKLN